MVIHDTRQGISWWKEAKDSVVYGNIIYYNGWTAPDRPHGPGIYAQNTAAIGGTKTLSENIIFRNFSSSFDTYNEIPATPINFDLRGNVVFNSGGIDGSFGFDYSILFAVYGGGNSGDSSDTVHENMLYGGGSFRIGYDVYSYADPNVHDNFMPKISVNALMSGSTANIVDNILTHTEGDDFDIGVQNTFRSEPLTGLDVFVRPNAYETGRANIIVYNWDLSNTVSVDLSSVLTNGDHYVVYNGQNVLASPVAYGTYSGSNVTLPMTALGGLTQATLGGGYATPDPAYPEFNVFLVRKT
jgi:hypothetical protein